MVGKTVRARGEKFRDFVITTLAGSSSNLISRCMVKFGVTRQAVYKHLRELEKSGLIIRSGYKRLQYALAPAETFRSSIPVTDDLMEDEVWEEKILPKLEHLPANVVRIWNHAFTEMFNNVIDHSDAKSVQVELTRDAAGSKITISDNGIGIFKKLKEAFHLNDECHAIFELSKGKLTTDSKNHSGEGIFFTSRMLDRFMIISGQLCYHHKFGHSHDFLVDTKGVDVQGTSVVMFLGNNASRTTKQVFDEYSSDDGNYGFNKTVIPIALAKYGSDSLVSRSQAKRVLARVELFENIVFDFKGVEEVGQAFADQIFRVFAIEHPHTQLTAINTTQNVSEMVSRAKTAYFDYINSQQQP